MIFRTALSQETRVGCITLTWIWKASHLNTVTPLLPPPKKNSRLNLLLEYDAHHFLGLHRHHSPEVHSQRHKYQLWEWYDDPKEATLVMTDIALEIVPHPPYGLDLTSSDFWLFAVLKKHFKRIHFTRDEEVQAAMGKCFQEEPEAFYSNRIQRLVQILHGKIWYRNQIHILSYILFLVHFDTFSSCKDTVQRHYFLNTLHMIIQAYSWNKLTVWCSICSTSNCILKVKKIHIKRLLTIDVSLTGASLLG